MLESILPVAVPNVTHPCYLRSAPTIVIAMRQKVFELATLADHGLALRDPEFAPLFQLPPKMRALPSSPIYLGTF